jgi:hypothetical protein
MYVGILRYKWTCDGIQSIDEGIERLEGRIEELKRIKELGGQVDLEANDDDYIHFYGENLLLKEELDFEDEKEFYGEEDECDECDYEECDGNECCCDRSSDIDVIEDNEE